MDSPGDAKALVDRARRFATAARVAADVARADLDAGAFAASLRPIEAAPLLDCLQLSDKARILLAVDDPPRALPRGRGRAESQRLAARPDDLANDAH